MDWQSDIAGESETGKVYRASFNDKQGHTALVMHPARQVTSFLAFSSNLFLSCKIVTLSA